MLSCMAELSDELADSWLNQELAPPKDTAEPSQVAQGAVPTQHNLANTRDEEGSWLAAAK